MLLLYYFAVAVLSLYIMQLTAINGIDLLNQTGIIEHLKQNSATQLIFDTKDVIEEKKDNEEMMNIVSNFITDADKETLCKICGTKWKYPSHLKRHLVKHTNVRKFKCDQCNATFKSFCYLKNHFWKHSSEPHFECKLCDKRYTHNKNLLQHKLQVHTDGLLKCNDCGKKYKRKSNLEKHKCVHRNLLKQ
ncbi:hypothetical protein DINM_001810 [Dirofilaria immitis]|nr:hypothetical protein [Dirofilaria immitis]